MSKRDKILIKWRNIILSAAKALEEKNYDIYDNLMQDANSIAKEMKNIDSLTYECKTFGQSNYIFEDVLPDLFKKNKNIVKEFITLIKEDKNLLSQFQFLSALNKYKKSLDAEKYIQESLDLVQKDINIETLNESNAKLAKLLHKYEIHPSHAIDENDNHFFESCDYVIRNKKKLNNLCQTNENLNYIKEYIMSHAQETALEKNNDIINSISSFDSKYNQLLNVNEKKILKNILSSDENQNKVAFNDLKNECLTLTSQLIENTNNADEKNKLLNIKKNINNLEFSPSNLLENITKILNVREVLIS